MSRQQRSHRKARQQAAQSVLGASVLAASNAARNRKRIDLSSGTEWNQSRAAHIESIMRHRDGDTVRDKRMLAAVLTVGNRDMRRRLTSNVLTEAQNDAPARFTGNGEPKDAGFRYVLYVAKSNVLATLTDSHLAVCGTENPASRVEMVPSTTWNVDEIGSAAQSAAWDTMRTLRDNGHVVTLQRFHAAETSEPMSQRDARLRQTWWINLPIKAHRSEGEALAASDSASDAFRAVTFATRQRPPIVQRALTDGITIDSTVTVVSVSAPCGVDSDSAAI